MSISKEDRAVLFGTENIQQQMKLFLLSQPGFKSTEKEMRNVFWDISSGLFLSTLIALETRGWIRRMDGLVEADEENIGETGQVSDRLWKMARIEKEFTIKTLSDYVPDASKAFIRELVQSWELMGYVAKKGKLHNGRSNVFVIIRDSVIRPKSEKKRPSDLVDAVWKEIQHHAKKGDTFTSNDIKALVPISSKYLADLLRQWNSVGLIEKVLPQRKRKQLEIYRCIEKGDRPIVITRSRIRETRNGKKTEDNLNPCCDIKAI